MMLIIATVVTLLLIMVLCPVVWVLDARQKLIDRQIAIAMPASPTASNAPSLRRQQTHTYRWQSVQRLLKYDSEMVYDIRPLYVVCAGIVAALADVYAAVCWPIIGLHCPRCCPNRYIGYTRIVWMAATSL